MQTRGPTIVPLAVAAIWALSAAAVLFQAAPLRTLAGGLTALLAVACVVRKGGIVRVYALALSAASVALVALDADPWAVLEGLERAGMFCAFLAGLYALRSMVETSPALGDARIMLLALTGETRRSVLLWLGWLLSIPLGIGALSVAAPLVGGDADVERRAEAATWGIRGMALTVLFSPFTVAMGLVTSMQPDIPVSRLVLLGLPISVAAVAAPLLTGGGRSPLAAGWPLWEQVGRVLAPVVGLIVLDLTASVVLGWSALDIGVVVVAPFALAVAVAGGPARLRAAVAATRIGWGRFDSEVAIFASALVFAALVTRSPTVLGLADGMARLAGPDVLVVVAMAAICVLSAVGVHMVVPAVVALSVLGPLMPTVAAKTALSMGVLIGWSFGAMTALGSISFLVATSIFAVPARRIAFGPNLPFMIGLCLVYAAGTLLVL